MTWSPRCDVTWWCHCDHQDALQSINNQKELISLSSSAWGHLSDSSTAQRYLSESSGEGQLPNCTSVCSWLDKSSVSHPTSSPTSQINSRGELQPIKPWLKTGEWNFSLLHWKSTLSSKAIAATLTSGGSAMLFSLRHKSRGKHKGTSGNTWKQQGTPINTREHQEHLETQSEETSPG